MKVKKILAAGLCWLFTSASAQTTLITTGSSWKYLDNGSNQGTSWRNTGFNDTAWPSGSAQLGYGDGDEATVVSYGPNSSSKYITTYFRKTISVANAGIFASYTLRVRRDDGVVVYCNGTELYRNNMPAGSISYTTAASSAASDDGGTFQTASLPSGSLVTGNNTIAVEIHQNSGSSSDISFDLELIGNPAGGGALLTRGPYLQSGTTNSMVLRWRTDIATDTKVTYGLTAGNLNLTASNASSVTDHEIKLTGLTADTKYYYSIGSSTQTLQGDVNNYFVTAPVTGTEKKIRVWATGDCGNNSTNQVNVRDRYLSFMGSNHTDIWLLLGDNAYSNGTDNEFQAKFFDIYKDNMLKRTILYPAPGNHDYAGSSARQDDHNIPYYNLFTLPTQAEAGGVASNTEAFYSYNYANVHFISLDSYGEEANKRFYDTTGAQVLWLKNDLAANTQKWTIVYWHHPPYTKGSHNSDTESELINTRQNLIRILERYKVDLILCGHSHDYERSYLIKGHYGLENTFSLPTHAISSSSAKYDGTASSCPYIKNAPSYNGTVYCVAGSAGQLGGTSSGFPHNAMYFSNATNGGSLALEIEGGRLDGKWVCADGVIRDRFTIMKDVNKTSNINISSGQSVVLTASWVGTYSWSTGATTRSITVSPGSNTTYSVNDGMGCLNDVFNINVPPITVNTDPQALASFSMSIFPNPLHDQSTLQYSIPAPGEVSIGIYDLKGSFIKSIFCKDQAAGTHRFVLDAKEERISPGLYLVDLRYNEFRITEKVLIK